MASGDDAVSWIKGKSGALENAAGERKASFSGTEPDSNCVVVAEVSPRG